MKVADQQRRTPVTGRADRADERIRVIEEAILLIRGDWPAAACGLYETVNRATGLIIAPSGALDEAIEKTAAEALRLVGSIYGNESVAEVRRLAAATQHAYPVSDHQSSPFRRRLRLPHLTDRRAHARAA